jgi:hypothetical protein
MNPTKSRKQGLTRLAVTLALVPVMALSSLAVACPIKPGKLGNGKLGPIPTFLVPECGQVFKEFISGMGLPANSFEMYSFKPLPISDPDEAGAAYGKEIGNVLAKYGYVPVKSIQIQDNILMGTFTNKKLHKNLSTLFIVSRADNRTMYLGLNF